MATKRRDRQGIVAGRAFKALDKIPRTPEQEAKTQEALERIQAVVREARQHIDSTGFPWPETIEEADRLARAVGLPREIIESGQYTIGDIRVMAREWVEEQDAQQLRDEAAKKRKRRRGVMPGTSPDPDSLTKEEKALATLVAHPEWNDAKIAEHVGCSRISLYRWDRFKAAREALESGRPSVPKADQV